MDLKKGAIFFSFLFLIGCSNNSAKIVRISKYEKTVKEKSTKKTSSKEYVYHIVESGQTLYRISKIYGLPIDDLKKMNNLENNQIIVGQKLLVKGKVAEAPGSDTGYYIVKNGDTLYSISRRYGISLLELRNINKLNGNSINAGQNLLVNSNGISMKSHSELKKYRWPITWRGITSPYGYRYHPVLKRKRLHSGVDLRASMNTPVYSAYSGKVTYAGWMRGYGKIIIIQHPHGYSTRYAHLNKILVKKGASINRRKLIGKSGNTGISTGPHLHYEIRYKGEPLNPIEYKR